jgi:hypothetical protein
LQKNPAKGGDVAGEVRVMRDWVADWKKWSRGERTLAVCLAVMMIGVPLGYLLATKAGV